VPEPGSAVPPLDDFDRRYMELKRALQHVDELPREKRGMFLARIAVEVGRYQAAVEAELRRRAERIGFQPPSVTPGPGLATR